jgi:hypothetical protein
MFLLESLKARASFFKEETRASHFIIIRMIEARASS